MITAELKTALEPVIHEGDPMVDARELHKALGHKRMFAHWIRERIGAGYEDGVDFLPIVAKTRGRPRKDYLLTIDMAKELAMLERTEIGREVRRYYIKMEQAAVGMAAEHLSNGEPERIPSEFFDARAAIRELEEKFSKQIADLITARSPGATPLSELPDNITARSVALSVGLIQDWMGPEEQISQTRRMGMNLANYCLLYDHDYIRGEDGKESNKYPKTAVMDYVERHHALPAVPAV